LAIEYDGAKFDSVEELIKYKTLIKKPIIKHTEKPTTRHTVKYTKEEDDEIVKYYVKYFINNKISKKGMNILLKKLNNRNAEAISKRASTTLKKRIKEKLDANQRPSKIIKASLDKNRKRMKFIHSRIKGLIKQNLTLGYENAFRIASSEWLSSSDRKRYNIQPKTKQIESKDLEFPNVWPLSNNGIKTFETILVDLIARGEQGKIDFFTAKSNLHLNDDKEWDGRLWKDFCKQFLMNKSKICKALNCNPKKMKVVIEKGYHLIKYY